MRASRRLRLSYWLVTCFHYLPLVESEPCPVFLNLNSAYTDSRSLTAGFVSDLCLVGARDGSLFSGINFELFLDNFCCNARL